jgi:hypothetical protein
MRWKLQVFGFILIGGGLALMAIAVGTHALDVPDQAPETRAIGSESAWEGFATVERRLHAFFSGAAVAAVGVYAARRQQKKQTGPKAGGPRSSLTAPPGLSSRIRSFWITYSVTTLSLLTFNCFFLIGPGLGAAVALGTLASSGWLFSRRAALTAERHLIPVALLASVGSVASGFILILAMLLIGEFFR